MDRQKNTNIQFMQTMNVNKIKVKFKITCSSKKDLSSFIQRMFLFPLKLSLLLNENEKLYYLSISFRDVLCIVYSFKADWAKSQLDYQWLHGQNG